ncbi:Vesicle-associated membrane protein 4 [Anabarilius grahami]|uniref:Vesicle-associated membrane protein 4 n=1 Tax=Anabarilius grahami TaxID=495550 RepID=A0A3N0ZC52_ANAGA|nr:Vesicle-associated membrane protein 4 [Anabarilius grahami]
MSFSLPFLSVPVPSFSFPFSCFLERSAVLLDKGEAVFLQLFQQEKQRAIREQRTVDSMREPEREEQLDPSMPPKFKRHLNDEEVTGSIRSERRNLLEEDSDEEEDFFLVQSQVDEVIDVMQENISKVIERGERLDELQDKSGKMDVDSTL